MTLVEQDHQYGIPPHAYRPEGSDPNRGPPPTLPSMSALLNPQPPRTDYPPQAQDPPLARQFGPPYNMTRESTWRSQLEGPSTPQAPHQYRTPPVPSAAYFSQSPTEPVILSQQQYPQQHDLAVPVQYGQPLVQRRQFKKITGRRGGLFKDGGAHHSERRRPSPLQSRPFEQDANYSPQKDAGAHSRPALPPPSDSSVPRPSMPNQSSRPLPVSGLLIEPPRSRTTPIGPTYSIRMRQQPIAARACGFGERDRRVIDPPPILQMDVTDPNASPEELAALIRQPYAVVHCTLWDPVNDCDDTAMPITTDKRQQRRLMGTLVSSPFVGKDEFNVEGCFFTFPDLSVRTPGTYSLRFQLVILNPASMGVVGSSSPVRSVVKSSAFNVFNAKDFRGMRASTALTKTLKHQGCLISVKKGNNKNETHDDEGSDEEGDEEDGGEGKRGKRSRR